MEVILFFILVYAAKKAWDDSKAGAAKSRKAYMERAAKKYPGMSKRQASRHAWRHDTGHALSQLLHGFPAGRHGFAEGWHEGKQAHAQARAGRERAKAEHLETRAALLPEIRGYLRRQQEAREEIRRQGQGEGSEGTPEGSTEAAEPVPATYCGHCGTRGGEQCPPECATWTRDNPYPGREGDPTYSYGYEGATAGWPAATAEQAHQQTQRMSEDGDPWVVTEYPPGGGPGQTIATYRNGEAVPPATGGTPGCGIASETPIRCMQHPDRACEWVQYEDGTGEHVIGPEQAVPGEGSSTTEGTTSMSDVTYDGVVRDMTTAVSDAETRTAEVNAAMAAAEEQAQEVTEAKARASTTADEMQALDMDPATLGAMADHIDALDEAEKAHQHAQEAYEAARKSAVRVMETAQNVSDTLVAQQGQMAEAHANTNHAAANEFFEN